MTTTPLTLAEYVGEGQRRVLVEHGRCGASLGVHAAWCDDELGTVLAKDDRIRRTGTAQRLGLPTSPGTRGPLTTPGLRAEPYDQQPYVRCYCTCLPIGHAEKRRIDKIGSLPVTFPEWKWGRSVALPVVVF